MNIIIKKNINLLLIFSLLLSFLNLIMILIFYFNELNLFSFEKEGHSIPLIETENSVEYSSVEENINLQKNVNEVVETEEPEIKNTNIKTFKEKFYSLPWGWISVFILISLGLYCFLYPQSSLDFNFRGNESFDTVSKLLEAKRNHLTQFQPGTIEYIIEKVKAIHINGAAYQAYCEGLSTGDEAYTSRVNEILNNDKNFQRFLNKHGIDGKDIYIY